MVNRPNPRISANSSTLIAESLAWSEPSQPAAPCRADGRSGLPAGEVMVVSRIAFLYHAALQYVPARQFQEPDHNRKCVCGAHYMTER